MKFIKRQLFSGIGLLLFVLATGCESRPVANNTPDTTAEPTAARTVDQEYQEFAEWVNLHASQADTATEDEWQEMKTHFNQRSMELEGKTKNWSEQTRQEWEELKSGWRETEGRADARWRDDTTTVK